MLQFTKIIIRFFIIGFFLLSWMLALAQQPTPTRADTTSTRIKIPDKILQKFPNSPFSKIDSTRYTSFLPDSPEQITESYDTLLVDFQQHDPVRLQFGLGNLGNAGSAYRNLVFDTRAQMGLDMGMHQYDIYKVNTHNLRFYKTIQPISSAKGMLSGSKTDGSINAMLARKFAGNINVSFEAHRLNQAGQYFFQRVRTTAVSMGASYQSKNNKYNAFLIYSDNGILTQDNGGTQALARSTNPNEAVMNVDLKNTNSTTRHGGRALRLLQHYQLSDSASVENIIKASHSIEYAANNYKYADPFSGGDLSRKPYYGILYTDPRGIRSFLEEKHLENKIWLWNYRRKVADSLSLPTYKWSAGARHTLFWLNQEPEKTTVNNLFLEGQLLTYLKKIILLDVNGGIGIGKNTGEYNLNGKLGLKIGDWANFEANLLTQRRAVPIVFQQFFVSQKEVWRNDFNKPLETKFSASLFVPKLDIKIAGSYFLLANYLYFNELYKPVQSNALINIVQLDVTKPLRVRNFHLDSRVALQLTSEKNAIRLPRIYSTHSLYFEGNAFKKAAFVRIGIDGRFNTAFTSESYNAAIGQFFVQNQVEIPATFAADAFIAMKVQRFRLFLKAENVTSLLYNKYYYLTARYPQLETYLRFGIDCRLFD
jgi:Putative porin